MVNLQMCRSLFLFLYFFCIHFSIYFIIDGGVENQTFNFEVDCISINVKVWIKRNICELHMRKGKFVIIRKREKIWKTNYKKSL